jgi:hypothetical protein
MAASPAEPGPELHGSSPGPDAARADVLAAGFTHREPGQHGAGFAAGGFGDRLAPGAVLAAFTEDVWADGLDRLDDDELAGLLCAWRRLSSWAAAGEAAVVTEFARRRSAAGLRAIEHLDDEIAALLTLTSRAAAKLTGVASGLARLPRTAAALRAGQIDWPKAVVIADETSCMTDSDAAAVEQRVVPAAPGLTTGQLRLAVRRAMLAVDAEAAIKRRKKAEKDARVEAWTESSGTGALAGRDLPPSQVIAADQRIDALARWLRDNGADGTLAQLRAKVFTALLTGQRPETLLPDPPATSAGPDSQGPATTGPATAGPTSSGPARARAGSAGAGSAGAGSAGAGSGDEPAAVGPDWPGGGSAGWPTGLRGSVNLTIPLTTWLGLTMQPGEAAGLGALDAETCRDLAAALAANSASRWCLTITGSDGRAVSHGCARASPGITGPGPFATSPPSTGPPSTRPPTTRPPSTGPPTTPSPSAGPPGDQVWSWLTGIRLSRLESAPCSHARESSGYRPSASLRHLINIRDRICFFPPCRRQAINCDQDHTVPYESGGRTCECNIGPGCRRHHQAKQAPGWRLEQTEPGRFTWTLPSGRRLSTTPGHYPVP